METYALLLAGALLAAAVVLYVLLPLIQGREAPLHRMDDEMSEEEHRRRLALSALRDVEYDYATGKLDDEDYQRLKGELSVEALRILEGSDSDGDGIADADAGAPEDEEGPPPDDPLEEEIARIRRGLREGRTCRACAHLNPEGSRFCGRCGRELESQEEASSVDG